MRIKRSKREVVHFGALCLLAFVFTVTVHAQKYEFSYRHVGDESGLSQNTVTDIVQDTLGFIWLSTNDGLNRYDGITIKVFNYNIEDSTSLSNGWINRLLYDKKGRLWVGTNRGLNLYNAEKQNFTRIQTDKSNADTLKGIPHQHIFDLYEDRFGRIWVSTWSQLVYTYDGKTFIRPSFVKKSTFPNDYVNRIIQAKDGTLWIGLFEGGLLKYDEKRDTLEQYVSFEMEKSYRELRDILSLSEDPITGDIWVGTKMNGLYRFNPTTKKAKEYGSLSLVGSLLGANIQNQLHDKGRFWVGNSLGLFEYNRSIDRFEHQNGLYKENLNIRVTSIFVDESENLWLGTELTGCLIIDLKPKKFKSINPQQLPSPTTWSMYEDPHKNMWIATELGLVVFDSSLTMSRTLLDKPTEPILAVGDFIITVSGYEEKVWLGTTFSGIYEVDSKTLQYKKLPLGTLSRSPYINVLEYNPTLHKLFIGSVQGLGIYDVLSSELQWFQRDTSAVHGLPVNTIWDFYFSRDSTVWITHDEGMSRYKPKSNSFDNYKVFSEDMAVNPSQTANMLTEDLEGNLWIGTENGLVYYNLLQKKTEYVFGMKDGMANDYIYGLLVDKHNSIWVSTNKGITQLVQDVNSPTGRRIRNYSSFDGLSSTEFNFNAFVSTSDGKFLFGGINGINYFYPDAMENNLYKPKQLVSELKINTGSKEYVYSLLTQNEIEFDYGSHVYEITMHVLEYTSPLENMYRFRLNGFDSQWREQTGKNKVIYTNLSPGRYTFEFKGSNNDKIFSHETELFTLVINPPIYTRLEFFLSVFLLVGILIYWGVSYREKKLILQNEYLESEVQKRAKELEKNEFIFKQITDNAADLISMLDAKGTIIYVSPSHKQLLGYTVDELLNRNVFSIIHEDDRDKIVEESKKLVEEGVLTFSEFRMKHKNGTWRSYQTAGSLIKAEEGDPDYRFVLISHDITRQKRIENNLIESKNEALRASQAKSAFLAGISHELRTPLNAIIGFSQVLSKETNLTPRQQSYIDTMLKSGNHLLQMINEVLDISRVEAGKMPLNFDNFSTRQFFTDLENMFAIQIHEKGLEFNCEYDSKLPEYCYHDAGKIRQVIINLLGNALKFTQKGAIDLQVTYERVQRADHKTKTDFNWNLLLDSISSQTVSSIKTGIVQIIVKDTGIGIEKEKLAQIFEPFQQAESKVSYSQGTGLGLAISSRLIRLLGGNIHTESELNKGSKFTIRIPVVEKDVEGIGKEVIPQKPKRIKQEKVPKVLIVDDIDHNHVLLKEMLIPIGFVCTSVYNGKEALEMIELFKPDVILMDLRMPVMDGLESTRLIRLGNQRDVKIVAISASGFDDNFKDPNKAGFDAFLLKPFKETDLFSTLSNLLQLEYDYDDAETVAESAPKLSDKNLLIQEITQLSKTHHHLLDSLELSDWEQLEKESNTLDSYPLTQQKLKVALKTKDFMVLIQLTELWNSTME